MSSDTWLVIIVSILTIALFNVHPPHLEQVDLAHSQIATAAHSRTPHTATL